jgi:hypothetical protein
MVKSEKEFDAVKMMRTIRDRLSDRFKDMTWEEEDQYIREHVTFLQLPRVPKGEGKLPNEGMQPTLLSSRD